MKALVPSSLGRGKFEPNESSQCLRRIDSIPHQDVMDQAQCFSVSFAQYFSGMKKPMDVDNVETQIKGCKHFEDMVL